MECDNEAPLFVENDEPPEAEEDWICPITQDVFYFPCVMPSGHRYEFDAIVRWLDMYGTEPMTREQAHIAHVFSSYSNTPRKMHWQVTLSAPPPVDEELRSRIEEWRGVTVAYHLAQVRILESNVSQQAESEHISSVREHYEAALDADPRNQQLHEQLVRHIEDTGSQQEARVAKENAVAAEAEEQARLQIEVTFALSCLIKLLAHTKKRSCVCRMIMPECVQYLPPHD